MDGCQYAIWVRQRNDLFCRFSGIGRCLGNVRIWTPPRFASSLIDDFKVRLRTYIRPLQLAYVDAGPEWAIRASAPNRFFGLDARGHYRVLLTPVRPVRHLSVHLAIVVEYSLVPVRLRPMPGCSPMRFAASTRRCARSCSPVPPQPRWCDCAQRCRSPTDSADRHGVWPVTRRPGRHG